MTDEQLQKLVNSIDKIDVVGPSFTWDNFFTLLALVISLCSLWISLKSHKENKMITIESEFNKYFLFIEDLYTFYQQIYKEATVGVDDNTNLQRFNNIISSIRYFENSFDNLNEISVPIKYRESFRHIVNGFWSLNNYTKSKFEKYSNDFLNYDDVKGRKVQSEAILKGIRNGTEKRLQEIEKLRFKNIK